MKKVPIVMLRFTFPVLLVVGLSSYFYLSEARSPDEPVTAVNQQALSESKDYQILEVSELKSLADKQNERDAQHALALRYKKSKNYDAAKEYFLKAATNGSSDSLIELSNVMVSYVDNMQLSPKAKQAATTEALSWLYLAKNLGNANASIMLELYKDGFFPASQKVDADAQQMALRRYNQMLAQGYIQAFAQYYDAASVLHTQAE
ncbi:hypothetical protein [Pleionea sp. CnH1-48]|uniref:hypothetical protein n=1 Tax=Pleionea sp. CnH1-48 TaxID=2954494 RepID=UPI002097B85F|nr:hypothetical protein [Pleionea sp. CnH1-48]MCO7223690.1 hypothetical protein [Pleionea sp. CnH1-48]